MHELRSAAHAQAAELDHASLRYLEARLAPAVATAGWPGPRQYRFENQDVRVMLWSFAGQCDWWISGSNELPLKTFATGLLDLSNLRGALRSNDDFGAASASAVAPVVERALPAALPEAPSLEQTVRAWHTAGHSQRAIARELNIDRRNVKRIIDQAA